ncbi:rhodanese-like domain-containing protein [Cecembia lonarensis]|uniref:Putative rhodanese-related sulfurtransferase n=1 Tax=Cecembia lonarensis (strain CCUG 58316 / KCTC 22772 / LW9) TaxID=1225176 RepID=K1LCI2_CECL9|nr:rhodanese-like domain-containing protein [Cecembia lonarensis]EKB49937.1 putative rhodanese-related sulfurtransferase [Cecembia lonarensis LW9]
MKKLYFIFLSLLLFSACDPRKANTENPSDSPLLHPTFENVNAEKFHELIQSGAGIIVDVRTLAEIQQGFIPNAVGIDIYQKDFEEKIKALPRDKDIYVYCTVGARSRQAAAILQRNGFEKIYNLDGGIIDWARRRYPITR